LLDQQILRVFSGPLETPAERLSSTAQKLGMGSAHVRMVDGPAAEHHKGARLCGGALDIGTG
jgi:hypothetical protein